MNPEIIYLTPKELAFRWRMKEQTLANWRHAGIGPPFIRVSTRVLYPIEGIIAHERLDQKWLSQEQSQETSAETPN